MMYVWQRPGETVVSYRFPSECAARENAVYNAVVDQKSSGGSAVYGRLSEHEKWLIWKSLEGAGWCILPAVDPS